MIARQKVLKQPAGDAAQIETNAALERAKIQASANLRRIFDEEIRQRASEPQPLLSRPAVASHS
jgi:hypothetical protein